MLHGHVASGSIGPRRPRAWFSTGDRDRARIVASMQSVADLLRGEGFPEVELRVFPGAHALGDGELDALVAWWLARSGP